MTRRWLNMIVISGCILIGTSYSPGQADPGAVGAISNLGSLGTLNPGIIGGGESMPGAVLVKITGEVQCLACTLEELGVEETPGDLYQFSHDNTHMIIKVTKATPDFTWEMVERHKLFLLPGEDAAQLHRLLSESKAGKRVELTGGVAPEAGNFIPLTVKVK
jgi:hypothetical protein